MGLTLTITRARRRLNCLRVSLTLIANSSCNAPSKEYKRIDGERGSWASPETRMIYGNAVRTELILPMRGHILRSLFFSSLLVLFTLPVQVQAQFSFITNNGAITITAYTGSGGVVSIPSSTNGYPVASIGNSAFAYKKRVSSVALPYTVTTIGTNAFYACTYLTNISMPCVASIMDNGLAYCTLLSSLVLPSNSHFDLGVAGLERLRTDPACWGAASL
jgi:BspA type Leucine rich repeat region (6 copies)